MQRHSKSAFLPVTLNLNRSKWISVVDILTQILLTLLTFIGLPIWRKISICYRWFLFGVGYYVNFQFTPCRMINGQQYGEQNFELECLPLTFIYSNLKFKVSCKNISFECRYIKTHAEEFLTLHCPFYVLLVKIHYLIAILSTWESTSQTQNLELANLKCVTYAQPIPLSGLKAYLGQIA